MTHHRRTGGHHYGHSEDTPTERPTETLDEHKPYIKTLVNLTGELSETNRNFSDLIHELRLARVRITKTQKRLIRNIFSRIKRIGAKGEEDFSQ